MVEALGCERNCLGYCDDDATDSPRLDDELHVEVIKLLESLSTSEGFVTSAL